MLSLSDAELDIIFDLARPIEPAMRDAFLRSVVLCTCTTRERGLVYRLAKDEQRRFLDPPGPRRSQQSARYNGGHVRSDKPDQLGSGLVHRIGRQLQREFFRATSTSADDAM